MKDVGAVNNGEPKNAGFDPAGSSIRKSQNNYQGQFSLPLLCPESGPTGGLFSDCCFVVPSIKASSLPGVRGGMDSICRTVAMHIHSQSVARRHFKISALKKKSKLANKIPKTSRGYYNTHTKPLPLVHL